MQGSKPQSQEPEPPEEVLAAEEAEVEGSDQEMEQEHDRWLLALTDRQMDELAKRIARAMAR